jgi:hypothetical protein
MNGWMVPCSTAGEREVRDHKNARKGGRGLESEGGTCGTVHRLSM